MELKVSTGIESCDGCWKAIKKGDPFIEFKNIRDDYNHLCAICVEYMRTIT